MSSAFTLELIQQLTVSNKKEIHEALYLLTELFCLALEFSINRVNCSFCDDLCNYITQDNFGCTFWNYDEKTKESIVNVSL